MLQFLSNILSYVFLLFGYISEEKLFPEALSKSEEEYLLKKHFAKDKEARNKLIEHNLRLVAHIAKKYAATTQDNEEYISIGTIGLIKGVDSFKEDKGFKLSTYCSRCIENEILMHLRGLKKTSGDVSINSVIGTDKDGNDMELIDVIEEESVDPIDNIYNKVITADMLKYINTKLSSRDRDIINMRYGLNGENEKTQQEIADMLNISRSYVSRIETKVSKKLNKFIIEEK